MRKAVLVLLTAITWMSLVSVPLSTAAAAANSASFVRTDIATMGSWIGVYGTDGYFVSQDANIKKPSYAQIAFAKQANWTWAASSNYWPALQKPEDPSGRIAASWFSSSSFTIDVNLTDGNTHQVALYALDWDNNMRAETVRVLDASTGAVLDSRFLSAGSFISGYYLVWNVQGHVKFEVVKNAGANADISGLFFDGVALQGATLAVPVNDFLSSLGVNTHIGIGYPESNYEPMFRYTGIRNARDVAQYTGNFVTLHQNTGVLVALACSCSKFANSISAFQTLANAGALLAVEGPNEPNNAPFIYNGNRGGGSGSWLPVAQCQRDLYAQIKANSTLRNYPVFNVSEGGAEIDNVGLQFLTIPAAGGTLMPAGTKYADYANTHNYVTATNTVLNDNQAWNAADPILRSRWDGLPGNYGTTWNKKFKGYSDGQLLTLPRVTTETGWGTQGPGAITEVQQGKVLMNVYLSQFKRGWRYTFIYEMRDQEGGDTLNMGLFHKDSTPKIAAAYIHNLTTILADTISKPPSRLNYSIPQEPPAVHDLLMQKSDGTFYLAVWDERVPGTGTDTITVNLGGTHASVTVYDPAAGTAAVRTLSNVSSVALTLSDHPQILAISGP